MKKRLCILLLWLCATPVLAQVVNTATLDTVGGERIGKITVGGYIDAYYGFNFNQPRSGSTPYMVSMNRHNELNINLGYIDLRFHSERVRARFVPGFGTYMADNYASEPLALRNLVESSVGYKLSTKKEIWLEAGVLGSPYTNESAISREHLMYTRSFAPEYVPYYLTGAKLSMPLHSKVNLYLYLLNGWQQIRDNNKGKSIGTQLEWRPDKYNLLNWNTYVGDERSIATPNYRNRYFTDLFWIFSPNNKFTSTSCAYIGFQQIKNRNDLPYWWTVNYIAKYNFTDKYSLAGRVEYFSDANNVQATPITMPGAFSTFSGGVCFTIKLSDNAMARLEYRHFYSEYQLYTTSKNTPTRNMDWLVSNMTVWF